MAVRGAKRSHLSVVDDTFVQDEKSKSLFQKYPGKFRSNKARAAWDLIRSAVWLTENDHATAVRFVTYWLEMVDSMNAKPYLFSASDHNEIRLTAQELGLDPVSRIGLQLTAVHGHLITRTAPQWLTKEVQKKIWRDQFRQTEWLKPCDTFVSVQWALLQWFFQTEGDKMTTKHFTQVRYIEQGLGLNRNGKLKLGINLGNEKEFEDDGID